MKTVYKTIFNKYNIHDKKPKIFVYERCGMAGYKKCTRCELNWIKEDEDLCDVCKAELKIGGISLIEDDEAEEIGEELICPVCKINPIEEGEDMCAACREEILAKAKPEEKDDVAEVEDDESWREFVEDDAAEIEPLDNNEEIFLSELEEEELEKDENIDEDESFDDLDASYDYGEDGDFDEEEDEEEELFEED